jgi:hypothetical protein
VIKWPSDQVTKWPSDQVTKWPVTKWSAVPCGDCNEILHSCSVHAQKGSSPSDWESKWPSEQYHQSYNLNGIFKGEDILWPHIPMIPTDVSFEFKRLQFPVRLAFVLTIKKTQGHRYKCGLNLENKCFSHGLLYVACSRVGKASDLFVYTLKGKHKMLYIQKLFNKHN